MSVEKETEEKIFEAARLIFQERGFEGARMQEIADKANINKSMLHYYYRSKDNLFFEVFKAGIKKIIPQLLAILNKEIDLKIKIKEIVEFYYFTFDKDPQLPSFIIYEMNQNEKRFKEFVSTQGVSLPQSYIDQVNVAIKEKTIKDIAPHQLLMNIISLCLMPIVAKNMVQMIFNLDDAKYHEFLEDRRQISLDFILDGIQYLEEP
ncbi:MAG: TetR/AcrR family transcriptional regulator [Balneola sp.]